ncbi:MAG: MFS transporter [Enterobacter hormaechei]
MRVIAGSIGNFIEWYEFAVYGFLATVIARNFFQLEGEAELTSLILTWASFAIAFFFRPLGAVVFGRIGDRIGRKPTLIIVLVLMTLATAAIGIEPVYASIGIAAPLIVTLLRILQGLLRAVAWRRGLVDDGFALRGKRGLYGHGSPSPWRSGCCGALSRCFALLPPEALHDWGWRIPFFLALPMGAVALWLRVSMEETPSFVQQREKPVVTQASTAATFNTILMGIGRVMVWSAAGYTYLVIMPTYLQSALHTGFNQALLIAVISNIGFALTIIPSGMLSDRIGRRTVMIIATVLLLILALPLLKILQAESSTLAVKASVVLIGGGLVGMLAGPGPAMLSEMFPTRVRYTGLGLAYSLSNAIFSGCAGLIITGLIKETGNLDIPAYYVMATAVVSIFALMTLRKDDHVRSLEE